MGRDNGADGWCILRCASPRTLMLAKSLADAGISAWAPMERVQRRVPRKATSEWRSVPLMPSYVFVQRADEREVRALEALRHHEHPRFSIAHLYGDPLRTSTRALASLFAQQQQSYVASLPLPPHTSKHIRKRRAEHYEVGEQLKMPSGPFAGLECTVERSDGRVTTVMLSLFGRAQEVEIETSQLRDDGVAKTASAA